MKTSHLALAALIGLLAALPTWQRGFSVGDEGHMLSIASRIAHHRATLYRDIATNVPPLPYETLAAAFRIVPETIQTERALGVVLVLVMACVAYALGASSGSVRGGALALAAFLGFKGLAFPHWSVYFYTEASVTLALAAIAIGETGTPSALRALACGSLLAVASGYKQTFAAFALLALLSAFGAARAGRLGRLLVLVLPSLVLWATLLARAIYQDAGAAFLEWNFRYHLFRFASDLQIPYPTLVPWQPLWQEKSEAVALFYYLPGSLVAMPRLFATALAHPALAGFAVRCLYLAPLAAAFEGARRFREPLGRMACLSLLALFPLSDASHLLDALLPAILLYVRRPSPRRQRPAIALTAVLLLLGGFVTGRVIHRDRAIVALPGRGNAYVSPMEAVELAALHEALSRSVPPGSAILALPYCPAIYFTGRYENVTPLYLPFPSLLTAGFQKEIVDRGAAIEAVVIGGGEWPHLPPLAQSAPLLTSWIERDFVEAERAGSYRILLRRDGSGRGPGEEAEHPQRPREEDEEHEEAIAPAGRDLGDARRAHPG